MSQVLYFLPQNGTWTNQGTAGAAYNATVVGTNRYGTNPDTGAHYWGNFAAGDFMKVPAGSAVNNLNNISFEIGFYYSGTNGHVFCKLWDKDLGMYNLHINENFGELCLQRYGTNGGASGSRLFAPTTTQIVPGHFYYIQVAWAAGTNPQNKVYPTIYIAKDAGAPVHQTSWDPDVGNITTTSWGSDSPNYCAIGNYSTDTVGERIYFLNGKLYVFRLYNSFVDFSAGGNWNTDKALWLGGLSTSSGITSNITHPYVGQNVHFTSSLQSGGVGLSGKTFMIKHTFSGTYTDKTGVTDQDGLMTLDQTFGSVGTRNYWSQFDGGGGYSASTSAMRDIVVGAQTSMTLSADDTSPAINQSVHFVATLTSGGSALQGKSVIIYHYTEGVRYDDKTANTDSNGHVMLDQSFGSIGLRYYYAAFAGDTSYAEITSAQVPIDVAGDVEESSDETGSLTSSSEGRTVNASKNNTETLAPVEGRSVLIIRGETITLAAATNVSSGTCNLTGGAE